MKKNNIILNLILIFSVFAILFAYFTQYILKHEPCNLCLIERIPYFLAIIIIMLNYVFTKLEKVLLILLMIIFFSATLISFYHFGIEQGFIEESLVCDLTDSTKILSAEEILDELKQKTISCKNVTFRIFGLSLATINTIISFLITIIVYRMFKNYEKN